MYDYPAPPSGDTVAVGRDELAYSSVERAWALLGDGDARTSLEAFAALAQASPRDAPPKAGYALAAAILGDHETAVWAMRRAFRIDPAPLHYLIIDDGLRKSVRELTVHYANEAKHAERNVDALFMMAALHYLLSDDHAARSAIAEAIAQGDSDRSARALSDVLHPDAAGTYKPSTP